MNQPQKSKELEIVQGSGTSGIITLFHWDGTFIATYRYKSLKHRKEKVSYWRNIYGLSYLKHYFIISPKIVTRETTKNKSVSH